VIKTALTHPHVLAALARCGHGSTVLIADGHFAAARYLRSGTPTVWMNYAPDVLTATQVLEPLLRVVSVQEAVVTTLEDGNPSSFWPEVEKLLEIAPHPLRGSEFVTMIQGLSVDLAVITGDRRAASCVLLTLGL
jgi:L-fucose mutarotase